MPKHLILFIAFMGLLMAIFYHPVPDPDLWDADSRHIALPEHRQVKTIDQPENLAKWSKEFEEAYDKYHQEKVLSFIH